MPGAYPELKGEALASFRDAMSRVKAKAQQSLGSDYETRDMRPQDIGTTNPTWRFSLATTAGWNTIISNLTIDNNRWVAIYGLKYAMSSPIVSQLKATAGGAVKMDRNIEAVAENQFKCLYFDPILIEQNQNLLLEAYVPGTTTNTAEVLAFQGVVTEKKGKVLAP